MISRFDMRDTIFEFIYTQLKTNKNIYIITVDFGSPILEKIKKKYPRNFINAGISEQNAITLACGMASQGKLVFVYSIASFIFSKAFEQIKIDASYNKNNINILAVGNGYAYESAGPTHHALEDIGVLKTIKDLNLYSPSDSLSAKKIVQKIIKKKSLNYVRLERFKNQIIKINNKDIQNGFRIIGKKSDKLVISYGFITQYLMKLKKNNFQILDLLRLKPINYLILNKYLKKYSNCTLIEEQSEYSGISGDISKNIIENKIKTKFKILNLKENDIYQVGTRDFIYKKINFTQKDILKKILS